jgi:hypothetical protein
VAGLPLGEGVFDQSGAPLLVDSPDIRVRLWHPLQCMASEVLAWRQTLIRLGVTQPFKQAHREIYVLTEAERSTRDHSNRFAGHIVQQQLLRALCRERGWTAPAFGSWEPRGDARPMKHVQAAGLSVVFWVEAAEEPLARQYPHLATDQVHFARRMETVDLVEVPPVLFSELMRDVDLFVSLASIGNDTCASWRTRKAVPTGCICRSKATVSSR